MTVAEIMITAPSSRAERLKAQAFRRRIYGGIVALGASAVLGVATYLSPSDSGIGTHQQLGLRECGWITLMDMPCLSCGMTTSFSHAADGNLLQSFLTQPMGAVLALATAMALLLGIYTAATGSRIGVMLWSKWRPSTGWYLGGFFVMAWIYKILNHKGVL